MREKMTTVSLRRGAITVDCAPAGLKDLLRYWKKEMFFDKKKHLRKMGGHYENLYTTQGSTVTTLPGFGHKILEFLRKSGCPFEVKDFRLPLPKPNLEKACQGLYGHQIEPVITALLAGGGIVSLPTGFGKALPNKTKLPTPSGWRTVGDIRPGDSLFGMNGKPVKVLAIHPQPEKKRVWEIEFRDGRTVECCEDHLWTWIERESHGHSWKTESTKVIWEKFRKFRNSGSKNYIKIPVCKPVCYPEKELPVNPYVLGAALGNGCFSEKDFILSSGDSYVPTRIAKILGCEALRCHEHNFSYWFKLQEPKKGKCGTHTHLKLYEALGSLFSSMENLSSADKYIPQDYLIASENQRLELLRGLLDTDGTVGAKARVAFSTTSRRLATGVVELVRSLGGIAHITVESRTDKYKSGFCAIVCIAFPPEYKKRVFTHPDKVEKVVTGLAAGNRNEKNGLIRVIDIRETDRYEDMTCFTVDSNDSLFLCGDYTVTHNTVCAGAIIRAFDPEELKMRGTPRIVFAAPDKDINQKNFEAFERLFPDREVGLVMSGKRKFSDDIQIITLDSLHLIDPSEVGILIVDEVHSAASADRSTSISTFHNAARWGVSATPTGRFDGGDVLNEGLFGPVVVQKTYQDAVKLGALVPIEVYWVKAPKPHIGMQYYLQYKQRDSKIRSAIIANPDYSQLVAGLMHRIPDSMSAICFTQWVKQMANIHALCPDISYVHAQTNEGVGTIKPIKPKERKEIYDKMVSGEIKKIFATHVYKQGVDFPSLDIVINASAGGSDITAKQIPGRASRKADGKDRAYVIDFTHDWDWYEHNGTRKPGPLMASDLARRRSYRDLGFNQTVVESIDELPFLKNTI